MNKRALLFFSFAITLLVWGIMTWPLPKYLSEAVPSSAINPNHNEPRKMVVGDHLQLKYRFWLISDYLAGNSPWGKNVYEFNLNNDAERQQPGAMYMPFSGIHALLALVMTQAAAWNITGLLTLWGTYLFTILLAGQYCKSKPTLFVFSLIGILFPIRYHSLLGGSPTGLSMMWPPMLMLGLEWLWREKSLRGGFLVGFGILFACFTDLQVFYLSAFLCLFWSLFILSQTADWKSFPKKSFFSPYLVPLIPVAISGLALLGYIHHIRQHISNSSGMSSGRTLEEIAIYSASPITFFRMGHSGDSQGNYLGLTWLILLISCLILFAIRKNLPQKKSTLIGLGLLWTLVLSGMVMLAMGTQGPFEGLPYELMYRAVPKWNMIRQPARVLTLLPPLLSLMLCVLVPKAFAGLSKRNYSLVLGLATLGMFAEYYGTNQTELCLLDTENKAYAAAAEDHGDVEINGPTRGLALPLWPGDTHWSALYIYYASLYNVRMINGYSPVNQQEYYDGVFQELRSMNSGVITEDQLDFLLENKITYLFLHEDVFPEIVSPFPVAHTLNQLLLNPRIKFLAHDKRSWSFKILAEADHQAVTDAALSGIYAPSRYFKPASRRQNAAMARDDSDRAGPYIRLQAAQPAQVNKSTVVGGEDHFWLMRIRGNGRMQVELLTEEQSYLSDTLVVDHDDWQWQSLSLKNFPTIDVGEIRLRLDEGTVDVEQVVLSNTPSPIQGETTFPLIQFFRAGSSELAQQSVSFDPLRDLNARILYGPRLPFAPGAADITLNFDSTAPAGSLLGTFRVEQPEGTLIATSEVLAGEQRLTLPVILNDEALIVFSFEYAAEYPAELQSILYTPTQP